MVSTCSREVWCLISFFPALSVRRFKPTSFSSYFLIYYLISDKVLNYHFLEYASDPLLQQLLCIYALLSNYVQYPVFHFKIHSTEEHLYVFMNVLGFLFLTSQLISERITLFPAFTTQTCLLYQNLKLCE